MPNDQEFIAFLEEELRGKHNDVELLCHISYLLLNDKKSDLLNTNINFICKLILLAWYKIDLSQAGQDSLNGLILLLKDNLKFSHDNLSLGLAASILRIVNAEIVSWGELETSLVDVFKSLGLPLIDARQKFMEC